MATGNRSTWAVEPGNEIVPGRVVRALLGGGARSEAYATFNERRLVLTVVKVLRPALVNDAHARRSMRREGELLAALDHPGLTRIVEMEVDGERPYIEIEHLAGHRLSTLVRRRGRFDPLQAARVGRALAATLHHLHTESVVHLDVKPSNVIIGRLPRLIDLSVARHIDRARRINGFVGTDAFMAPEQADPSLWSTISPKTDVWGLGVTLYHALAARAPYATGDRHAAGPARFPQLVEPAAPLDPTLQSSSLAQLIVQSLSRSPDDRPSMWELMCRCDDLARGAAADCARIRWPDAVGPARQPSGR